MKYTFEVLTELLTQGNQGNFKPCYVSHVKKFDTLEEACEAMANAAHYFYSNYSRTPHIRLEIIEPEED